MKIQAVDIQIGECVVAYCNQKMQACTVRQILDINQDNITLLVYRAGHYRKTISHVIRFRRDALVEMVCSKSHTKDLTETIPFELPH
ncbi:MAG: hypothetical protein JO235_03500 [Chroococcidiopsidaceae cyanobacterium CP_BM_RX_35]|nr:hypothetical protein [Chroococcidiopsidaceae cyanobacterium CP_BM_RX_35]